MPSINPVAALFGDRDYVFGANNKTHIFRIGGADGVILPLQPIVSIRGSRNWAMDEVAGSGLHPTLSGTQVKDNMGTSDFIIEFQGFLMSTSPTTGQSIGLMGGYDNKGQHWADKLQAIRKMYESGESLILEDWAPSEESLEIPSAGILNSDTDPFERKDDGVSMLEKLGITHAVWLSLNISEIIGADRKAYTLRLQQDRIATLEDITPYEELEQ
jgi:hypothetical protein